MDGDIIQSLINVASIALNSSQIESRCIPASICLLVKSDRKSPKDFVVVQPTKVQIRNQIAFSHKCNFVFNVDTEEIISLMIKPIGV
mgnify:CR=1 FL=1